MKFPKLKNARLCRFIPYILVIGAFLLPIPIVLNLAFVPESIQVIVVLGSLISLLVYIFKNFSVLMAIDLGLAMLSCYNTARKRYELPKSRSIKKIEKRVSAFGKDYAPVAVQPKPSVLRYKFNSSLTVYSKGTEKVVITYNTGFLDKETYISIYNSANANSRSLIGKKKPRLLDKNQKSAPLNRVTVVIIFASRVDPRLSEDLFETVCKNDGNEIDTAFLPCVIDVEKHICVFNSMRFPYTGFAYPVKNRGIRFIKNRVFGGKLPLANNQHMLEPLKDLDPNQSLWNFWRNIKKELILNDKNNKKRFESMSHGQIVFDDDFLYIKWENMGVWLSVELDEEAKKAEIDAIYSWDYPKSNKIPKKAIKEMEKLAIDYFSELGYSAEFVNFDE